MEYNNIDDYLNNVQRSHFKNKIHKAELKIKILNSIKERKIKEKNTFFNKKFFNIKYALSFAIIIMVIISIIFIYKIYFYYPVTKNNLILLNGSVYIQKNLGASNEVVSKIESIKQNYIIYSEKDSSFKLKIENDTEIIAEEDSILKVKSLMKKNNQLINIFQLDKGKIECSVHLPSKDSRFEIITPDSIIYIKGTILSIYVDDNKDMILNVKKGIVEVEKKLELKIDQDKIKKIEPEVYDKIKKLINEKNIVMSDSSLTLKHDDIIILTKEINDLLLNIEDKKMSSNEINEKLSSIIELNKNISEINIIKEKESEDQSDHEIYKNEIENLLNIKWILFAENDFSEIITPKNFSSFVLYEGNGNFNIDNKRCNFTGDKNSSTGIIFLKKPDDINISKYKISTEINYMSGKELNLYLGTLIDINHSISVSINISNININDSTGTNIKSIEHNLTDIKNLIFEVIIDEKTIYIKLIDKQSSKELKSIIEKNALNIRGEAFIKVKGNGKIIFDNIKVYLGK